MPEGLRVVGSSGYYQIDETTVNMVLTASGTLSVSPSIAGGNTLTLNAETPLLVIRSTDTWVGVWNCSQSGNQFTYNLVTRAATTISWYLFDRQPSVPIGGMGLAIWDASGRLSYSTSYKPLRIVGVIEQSTYQTSDGSGGVIMPSGVYGVVATTPAYHKVASPGGGTGGGELSSAVRTEATRISAFPAQYGSGVTQVPAGDRTTYVVVDLSGY